MASHATSDSYLEQVNRAIDYIIAHLDRPLRLQDVAEVTSISPFHFHRVFQALVGETPAEFSRRLRLEKALKLMAYARRGSLTGIALSCGFSSSSDFSRSFKRHFGTAPRSFDIEAWLQQHGEALTAVVQEATHHVRALPPRENLSAFQVTLREMPARQVAYIRVSRPYQGSRVIEATRRLMAWARRHGLAQGQWLGYQWDHPGITDLKDCRYYVAVEAAEFTPQGEIGRFQFPPMLVAQVEIRGNIDRELQALHWLYGTWLPRSRYVPDDHPGFESWIGLPFAHGTDYFEIHIQLPVRRVKGEG